MNPHLNTCIVGLRRILFLPSHQTRHAVQWDQAGQVPHWHLYDPVKLKGMHYTMIKNFFGGCRVVVIIIFEQYYVLHAIFPQ